MHLITIDVSLSAIDMYIRTTSATVSEDASTRKREATQRELDVLIQAGHECEVQQSRELLLLHRIQALLQGLREARTLDQAWNRCVEVVAEGANADHMEQRGSG